MTQKTSAKETGRRKKLSEKIELLGSIEHGEIFRKLKMRNLGYTQNSNGIFFDITEVPGDVIDDLVSFVDHCIENQKMLKTSRRNQFLRSSEAGNKPTDAVNGTDDDFFREEEDTDPQEGVPPAAYEDAPRDPVAKAADPPPVKKPSSKFQHTRKKYSRPVASKVTYVNELKRE